MAIIFEKTNLGRYVLKIGDAENCLKNSKNAHTHAMYVSLRLKFQMVFEQMSPLIRQMDTGKIEIFGLIESC